MKTPHRHAAIIKAWADGAEIQFRYNANIPWSDVKGVCGWDVDCEFRVKPEPKPDHVYYGVFEMDGSVILESCFTKQHDVGDEIKLTFDGETGKLKSAEVL